MTPRHLTKESPAYEDPSVWCGAEGYDVPWERRTYDFSLVTCVDCLRAAIEHGREAVKRWCELFDPEVVK